MPTDESTKALSSDITQLLLAWSSGDRSAGELLFDAVYGELRRQAARAVHWEPAGATLWPSSAAVVART